MAVQPIITACLQDLEPLINARAISFIRKEPQEELLVNADQASLSRLFLNILDNAVKFTAEKSTVTIVVEQAESKVLIHVKDEGPGISAADQQFLFERFWQGGASGKFHVSIGLGLYLCRRITEALGGTIVCLSEPGAGATFTVTLPLAPIESGK